MRGQFKRAHALSTRVHRPVRPAPPRHSRRGFSLLEILVAIGIIMLLVGIAVITFGALNPSGRATKVTLGNLHGMLGAYEAQAGLREQPQVVYINNSPRPTTGASPASLWAHVTKIPDRTGTGSDLPADLTTSSPTTNGRYRFDGVANAQRVYNFLGRVPANKQAMTALPSKQVLGQLEIDRTAAGGRLLGPSGSPRQIDPPLVLDAWGNPVVFVGSGGLDGVTFEAQASGTTTPPARKVTSVGIFNRTEATPQTARPFFASAGPDGNIRTGDDNMYSFEN